MISRTLFAVSLTIALLAATDAASASVIISDGTFNNTDWTQSLITNINNLAGTTFSATPDSPGGNPGDYRRTTHNANPDGSGLYNSIRIQNTYTPFTLSGVEVLSIDVSMDLIYLFQRQFPSMAYQVAVFQGGLTYTPLFDANFASLTSTWVTYTRTGLTAANFCLVSNQNDLDCTAHPDFTGAGGAMQFGYVAANGLPIAAVFGDPVSGLDNFQVTIHTVPEPATYASLGLGLALIALSRLRKHRKIVRP